MNAQSIIAKVEAGLRKVGDPARQVYKRTLTRSGSDNAKLLGRDTVTVKDDLLDPQPLVARLGAATSQFRRSNVVLVDNQRFFATDYVLTLSPNAITDADLRNPDVLFVFKDDDNNEEVCEIVAPDDSAAVQGMAVVLTVIVRSKSR